MSANYLDRFAMCKPCGDCAFTHGSDAHNCSATRLTADLCLQSGEPFYCHRAKAEGGIEARTDSHGEPVLCRGFVDAFVAQGPVKDWQAAVASECLRVMEDVKDGRAIAPDELYRRVLAAGEAAR